ncbi:MAG: hypothetical protein JHC39_02895 [Lentimicrobium sp.]|nr:hypothetical protein [Lentimicrobium sp.]
MKIIGNSTIETKVIDSLKYNSLHANAKAVADEVNTLSERLSKIGYIENQILENSKENDSTYTAKISLGTQIKSIHIYIGRKILSPPVNYRESKGEGAKTRIDNNSIIKDLIGLDKTKDSLILPYSEIESFLNSSLQKLEQNGYALAKLQLVNIQKKKNLLFADLQFDSGRQRELDEIVVQFGESSKKGSFPKGHLKQMNRKYRNTILNQETVRKVQDDFEKFGFVNQVKNPELLFTQDTTKIYVYLEKRKSNTFDGFIGFANNENGKLTFNGYLDLVLENTIKAGEQFSLYWKSDGNNQKTFKTSIDLPYIFKSPIGLKAQIYIFKQDSIYQNTKTAIDLGYFADYNTRIYLGYQSTESSDIQNTNNSTISDYKNSFLTANLEYSKFDFVNSTFPKKTNLSITMGLGKRTTTDLAETAGRSKQTYININAMHNFYLNKKNCFNINYQNYFLKSDTYIINELYRFGGINSIRGFAENSLQANFMTAIITEYRYIISPDLYMHSIMDYGYYQDDSSNKKGNLLGFGLGLGVQTRNGLLKLAIANGSTKTQEIKGTNTIVTISFKTNF